MSRYSQDPFWMKARFASRCACGNEIPKGADIFYYPKSRTALCDAETCGKKAHAEFQSAVADEATYSGQTW